jgi:hypothetical protein
MSERVKADTWSLVVDEFGWNPLCGSAYPNQADRFSDSWDAVAKSGEVVSNQHSRSLNTQRFDTDKDLGINGGFAFYWYGDGFGHASVDESPRHLEDRHCPFVPPKPKWRKFQSSPQVKQCFRVTESTFYAPDAIESEAIKVRCNDGSLDRRSVDLGHEFSAVLFMLCALESVPTTSSRSRQ